MLFGSDAAVDGPLHFVRSPPNIEMTENYNRSLLTLARQLPAEALRALLEGNTRRLFRLAVGAENPVTSCDLHVFVDESAEPVSS